MAIVINGFSSNVKTWMTLITLLKSKNENWYCILHTSEILPFCQVNEKISIPKGDLNKPTGALVNLMNQKTKNNELNLPNCKYWNIDYFKNLTKGFKKKALSFFHINVCSLTKNIDDFNILLSELNVSFDILAITESRIRKDYSIPINLQSHNYLI